MIIMAELKNIENIMKQDGIEIKEERKNFNEHRIMEEEWRKE